MHLQHNIETSLNGLTAEQVAQLIGVTPRAVTKKRGINQFVIGQATGGVGRSARLYHQNCLSLWPHYQAPEVDKQKSRRGRSDCGVPRKCTAEQWNVIVERVKGLFLSNAQKNLKLACEEAERQLSREGIDIPLNIYKRLSRSDTNHKGQYISEFRSQNWNTVHDSKWRKKDMAIAMPTLRYDYLSIFESAKWAGEGYGALRAWAIDVRKNDVWVKNDGGFNHDREHIMPSAIYIRDVLTGYPLWMEPIGSTSESQEDLIRAYISCGLAWGRFPDIAVGIDNGKAMIADRTKGVIAASLPDTAWSRAEEYPEIFGHSGSPITQNLPNTPQSIFKAALERSFKQIKDEFDATRFPRHYQGGSRKEAVQLNLAAMPVFPKSMLTANEYYKSLAHWLWSDYVNKPRPRSGLRLFADRGWDATLTNAFEYYGGSMQKRSPMPEGERLARMVFFATENPHKVKAQLGYVDATINGKYARWMCSGLDHTVYGRKVYVIPVPGHEQERAVIMLADERDPLFLGFASNGFIQHIDQLASAKSVRNDTMKVIRDGLKEERDSVEDGEWKSHTSVVALPATSEQEAGEVWVEEAEVVEEVDDEENIEQLLDDVEDLLDD